MAITTVVLPYNCDNCIFLLRWVNLGQSGWSSSEHIGMNLFFSKAQSQQLEIHIGLYYTKVIEEFGHSSPTVNILRSVGFECITQTS